MTTNKLGLEVRDLTADDVQQLKLDSSNGVVVTQVRPFSPAWDSFPNWQRIPVIITEVDGKPVKNVEEYNQVLDSLKPGQTVYVKRKLAVQGQVQETYTTLRIPEK